MIEKAIEQINKILNYNFVKNTPFASDLESIVGRLSEKSFKLAVVGEFSSGKSTFLNALIKQDLLKHGTTETTATITEIENVNSDERKFDAYFTNGKIEKDISLDKLEDYTSTSSKTHSVASEITKVVIKCKVFDSDFPVRFIDTPGLNGVADNHREKTIEQVKNAHACIYLLSVRGIGESDIEFIKYISNYQKNIIFVQNFIDELKSIENETTEEKIAEQKKILEEKIFNGETEVEYSVLGISARKALLSTFTSYDGEMLSDAERARLYEESLFENIISAINNLMQKNSKESLFKKNAIQVAVDILGQILDILEFQNAQKKEELEFSQEARKKRGYENIKSILEKNKENYKKNISNFITAESGNLRKLCNKNIEDQLSELCKKVEEKINSKKKIDELQELIDTNAIATDINAGIVKVENETNKLLNAGFENILCDAVVRIKEYTGAEAKKTDNVKFDESQAITTKTYKSFTREEEEIKELNSKYYMAKEKEAYAKEQKEELQKEIIEADGELRSLPEQKTKAASNMNNAIRNLGAEPAAETKYKTEIHRVSHKEGRGFLGKIGGWIQDFVVGYKEETRTVPYKDYSKQNEWRRKKNNIENNYRQKLSDIEHQKRLIEQKINNLKSDIDKAERDSLSNESESLRKLLDTKKEFLAEAKKKAMGEYLRNIKKELITGVKNYLYDEDNVQESIMQNFENACNINENIVEKYAVSIFEVSFNDRLKTLSDLISNGELAQKTSENEEIINKIQKTQKTLEEIVCQM